jgi:hypothetical protein
LLNNEIVFCLAAGAAAAGHENDDKEKRKVLKAVSVFPGSPSSFNYLIYI